MARQAVCKGDIDKVIEKMSAIHDDVNTIKTNVAVMNKQLEVSCKQIDENKGTLWKVEERVREVEKNDREQKTFLGIFVAFISATIAAVVSFFMR